MPPPGNAKHLGPRKGSGGVLGGARRVILGATLAAARAVVRRVEGLHPQGVGLLLAVAAPLLWSTSGLFIKVLAIDPLPLTSLRCAMAGVILSPLVRSWRIRPGPDLIMLIAAYTAMSVTFVTATKWTTAANAIALQSTSPAWVFLAGCLLARAVPWRLTTPIAIILAGLAVILLEPAEGISFHGNLMGLGAGVTFALVNILYTRVKRPVLEVVVLVNLGAALVVFLIHPGGFRFAEYTPGDWLSLAYLGGVQIGLGHICFYGALKRISLGQAAMLTLLEPILNPIWVYIAVGEIPTPYGFAGAALIVSGIAVDSWLRRGRAIARGTGFVP